MSLLLADDGIVLYHVNVDIPVPVTVLMTKSTLFKVAIAALTTILVGVQKLIKPIPIAISVSVSVNLQRKINKFINVAVSVAVTVAERMTLHVSIAVTSAIIVAFDAMAVFLTAAFGSLRKKRRGPE